MQIRLNLNPMEVPLGTKVQEALPQAGGAAKPAAQPDATYLPSPDLVRYQQALAKLPDIRDDVVAAIEKKLARDTGLVGNPVEEIASKVLSAEFWPPLNLPANPGGA